MKKTSSYLPGFSLIEILVYLSIFSIVSISSVTFLLSLNKFIDQYRLEAMLYRSGTNSMEQIILAIRQADQIDLVNTIEDNPATGKLTLKNASTTTAVTFSAGKLNLKVNGKDLGNLMTNGVTVNDFTVYYYSMVEGDFVRVRLTMTAVLNSSTSKSVTLYGGAVIRGSI